MQVGSEQWIALLLEGAGMMGVSLTPDQAGLMARHAQTLLQWNRKINLTAITEPEAVAVKHFLDAILPLAHIPEDGRLLDIGTGGGFPGIPLKIMRPGQSMTLIDASRKKIHFVKHVIRLLGLPDITAVQSRLEALGGQVAFQKQFQVIVSRAFADLDTIAQMAMPLLKRDGKIVVYQGPNEEVRRSIEQYKEKALYTISALHDYQLPILGDRRTLVVITRAL